MSQIERRIDKLGRIVLPINCRKRLKLTENSSVCIAIEDNSIILTPSSQYCALCGSDSITNIFIKNALEKKNWISTQHKYCINQKGIEALTTIPFYIFSHGLLLLASLIPSRM